MLLWDVGGGGGSELIIKRMRQLPLLLPLPLPLPQASGQEGRLLALFKAQKPKGQINATVCAANKSILHNC